MMDHLRRLTILAFRHICFFAFGLASVSHWSLAGAEELSAPQTPVPAGAQDPISFSHTWNWWNAVTGKGLVDSAFNPSNQYLGLPHSQFSSDLRPDLKWTQGRYRLVARPRLVWDHWQSRVKDTTRPWENSANGKWIEGFLQWQASETIQVTYGLQNFQWGPAEGASPSNRIFHDTVQAKDLLYDVKGHHLMRVNLTPSGDWSEVLLIEPGDNGDPEFEHGEPFAKKAALKSEYSWSSGAEYLGVILGWRDRQGFYLGEYGNVQLTDGLTFYVDAQHQRGSLGWYPTRDAGTGLIGLTQREKDKERIFTFANTGLRYAFENGNDLRVEWIFFEAGYTPEDQGLLWQALTASSLFQLALLPNNLVRLKSSGLDFQGRQMGLLSLRIPDIFSIREFQFYIRYLGSMTDGSASVLNSWEYPLSQSGVGFATVAGSVGSPESELRGVISHAVTGGYRHSW